jgi:DNA-directed RNA polymerase subunit M/transcription elongation factor TFIIS
MGFDNECNRILVIHKKFDLDDVLCDKCKFKSHSQGLLKIHKQKKQTNNDTFEDVVEGFKNDIEDHIRTLEAMCEAAEVFYKMKCDKCEYRNNSEGNLRIHKRDLHARESGPEHE